MDFWVFRNLIVTTVTVTRGRDYLFLYQAHKRLAKFAVHLEDVVVNAKGCTNLRHRLEVRSQRAVFLAGDRDVLAVEKSRIALRAPRQSLDKRVMRIFAEKLIDDP